MSLQRSAKRREEADSAELEAAGLTLQMTQVKEVPPITHSHTYT